MTETSITFRKALFLNMTIKRAFKVGCVVGTILIFINQGDNILAGNWPPMWKIILTFMVPYSVSSYASAAFISEFSKRHGSLIFNAGDAHG